MTAPPSPSPKAQALRWLARREHSRAELERKLLRGLDAEDAEAVRRVQAALDELAVRGLLSDERAAESVVASRLQRYGSRRLRQELQARGLAPDLVASTLAAAEPSELDRARALWQRKFDSPAPAGREGAKERARQARFLAGRGFTPDVIRRVIQAAEGDDD